MKINGVIEANVPVRQHKKRENIIFFVLGHSLKKKRWREYFTSYSISSLDRIAMSLSFLTVTMPKFMKPFICSSLDGRHPQFINKYREDSKRKQ
jgi:hypothetical protein